MISNFDFLKDADDFLFRRAKLAESIAVTDCITSLMVSRQGLEYITKIVYAKIPDLANTLIGQRLKRSKQQKIKVDLNELLWDKEFQEYIESTGLHSKLVNIKQAGNDASHLSSVTIELAKSAVVDLQQYTKWYYLEFLNGNEKSIKKFDITLIPLTGTKILSAQEFEQLEAKLSEETDNYLKQIEELKAKNSLLNLENENLVNKIAGIEEELNKANENNTQRENEIKEQIRKLQLQANNDEKYIIKDAGITKQVGKIWGRLFLNLSFKGELFFAVKYYSPNSYGKATERFHLSRGEFQNSHLFTLFPEKQTGLSHFSIKSKEFDKIELSNFSQDIYKIPSIYLNNLLNDLQNIFMHKFEFYGSYYSVNGQMYRNLLTIEEKETDRNSNYELLVVMMNPGGSKPKASNVVLEKAFLSEDKVHLADCEPDETQHQIIRLMNLNNWKRAAVINLLDICDPNSTNVLTSILTDSKIDKEKLKQSIFHEGRRNELKQIIDNLTPKAPIILAWGTDLERKALRDKIKKNVLVKYERKIAGYKNNSGEYYHPWPREQEKIRLNWPDEVNYDLR